MTKKILTRMFVQQTTDFLNAAQLKKKEVQSKNSKRTKTWIDKLHGKHKATKSATSTTKEAKVCCNLEIPT
jgi:hypothetical protein